MKDNIPEFPGYHITEDGRLFSRRHSRKEWREMNLYKKKTYVEVKLHVNKKSKQVGVHRLVLLAYIGQPPTEKHECRHLDGDPHNNNIENLAWGTKKENKQDQFEHGTANKGEKCHFSKLTEDQVKEIFLSNESSKIIQKRFNLSSSGVSGIRNKKSWKEITINLNREYSPDFRKAPSYVGKYPIKNNNLNLNNEAHNIKTPVWEEFLDWRDKNERMVKFYSIFGPISVERNWIYDENKNIDYTNGYILTYFSYGYEEETHFCETLEEGIKKAEAIYISRLTLALEKIYD